MENKPMPTDHFYFLKELHRIRSSLTEIFDRQKAFPIRPNKPDLSLPNLPDIKPSKPSNLPSEWEKFKQIDEPAEPTFEKDMHWPAAKAVLDLNQNELEPFLKNLSKKSEEIRRHYSQMAIHGHRYGLSGYLSARVFKAASGDPQYTVSDPYKYMKNNMYRGK